VNDVRALHQRAVRRRRALNLLVLAGAITALGATTLAVRQYLLAPSVVLDAESAIGASPRSTVPLDAADVDRESPRSIIIDDIELWGPIGEVGIEDDGELEVPDEATVGWYKYGSAPGLPGATVLAAHVSWNGAIGPFHQLGKLEPGAHVDVRLQDGTLRTYQVVERAIYAKDELPRERIWTTTGDETLVLITCGGSYNSNIRRYRENIVVYAVPIASVPYQVTKPR
jgi:LPXTG-site transpeptidase (sortase) family protein